LAVLKAYGFSAKKDLLQQLLDLNLDVAARIERGQPVTAPGILGRNGEPVEPPPGFPDPKSQQMSHAELARRFATCGSNRPSDCIRPAD
jgi:hypothetical protein